MLTAMDVELHIEELILEGFAPGDRYSIGEAVERDLTRLLNEEGVPRLFSQNGDFAHLDPGIIRVASGTRAETIGRQVGQAIYQGAKE